MKRVPKPVFFIVALLILCLSYAAIFGVHSYHGDIKDTYIKGVSDIRWGIDIRGGVEATFKPKDIKNATPEQIDSAKQIIGMRLTQNNITDYELYSDYPNQRIIVRFPWKSDETDFNPETALNEISATADLQFHPGDSYADQTTDGSKKTPTGETKTVLMTGSNVKNASVQLDSKTNNYVVNLELKDANVFKDITTKYLQKTISITMDDVEISAANVNEVIPSGSAQISGSFTADQAKKLADQINAGALPFKLSTASYGAVSPTLGVSSLTAMGYAAVVALILILLFMLFVYRLQGLVAAFAITGQLALSIAFITGFFTVFPSFTMTLPGIAGIILSIGIGADANIITFERVSEELRSGKTIDGAIDKGTKRSFTAIFDGNITIVIVSLILLLVFGPANILSVIFGVSTIGTIYSFGYTLLMGVFSNFIMGVGASRLMLKSVSRFKIFRKNWFFGVGGAKQ
ncbi:MAG: SecD/SecF family protein translocase subunit [Bacillota bacterium]|nr:SecD/SecF family protein translocase subunit [Bacillota bacterium]